MKGLQFDPRFYLGLGDMLWWKTICKWKPSVNQWTQNKQCKNTKLINGVSWIPLPRPSLCTFLPCSRHSICTSSMNSCSVPNLNLPYFLALPTSFSSVQAIEWAMRWTKSSPKLRELTLALTLSSWLSTSGKRLKYFSLLMLGL